MARLATVTALLAALVLPASALAGNASVVDGQLRYVAGDGERNRIGVELTEGGDAYTIWEFDLKPQGDPAEPTVGPGCTKATQGQVRCPAAGIASIALALDDLDDLAEIGPLGVPLSYSGGAGTDAVNYPQNRGVAVGITITADGRPDDGPAARDNVAADVETIHGSVFADTLANGPGGGTIGGGQGDDRMAGGAGNDLVLGAYVEDVGTDSGSFYPRGSDTIACGGGRDMVFADLTDRVAADCEAVGRNRQGGGFEFTGSNGPDRISVPYGWSPATVWGRGGDDLLITNFFGASRIVGGAGNDRIQGGSYPGGRLEGNSGNDRIRARTKPAQRDRVICGSGRDTAIVDRKDVVSGCERVLRG